MFKKLKDKIAEDLKFSPQRIQQLTQTVTDRLQNSSGSPDESLFSIADDDNNTTASPTVDAGFTDVSLRSASPMGSTSRRLSGSSMASDASFLPRYDPPSNMYHMQSDLDVSASEFEDSASASSQPGQLGKEQVYAAFQKAQMRYHKYRGRYTDLAHHYRLLERENAKVRAVLVETQDKAIRRANELREQCTLEQRAKAHLENTLRVDLDERQMKIESLETKIRYLQSDAPAETNDEAVEQLTRSLSDARAEIEGRAQEMKANAIVFGTKEAEYKQRIGELERALRERAAENAAVLERERENNLKIAETKMELHAEIDNKDAEINKLKAEIEKVKQEGDGGRSTSSKIENLQSQNTKLIDKVESLTQKCSNYENDLIKLEQRNIEIANLNEIVNGLRGRNKELEAGLRDYEKLKDDKEIRKGEIENLKRINEELASNLERANGDAKYLTEKCSNYENDLVKLEQKNNEILINLEKRNKEFESDLRDYEKLKGDNKTYKSEIENLKRINEELANRDANSREVEKENAGLRQAVENLTRLSGELQDKLMQKNGELEQIVSEHQKSMKKNHDYEIELTNYNKLENENERLADDIRKLRQELEDNLLEYRKPEMEEYEEFKSRNEILNGDIKILEAINKELTDNSSAVNNELQRLRCENKTSAEHHDHLLQTNHELEGKLEEYRKDIERMNESKRELEVRLEEFKNRNETLDSDIKRLEAINQELTNDSSALNDELRRSLDENRTLTENRNGLLRINQELETKLDECRGEIETVRDEARSSLITLEGKIKERLQLEFDQREAELRRDFDGRVQLLSDSEDTEKELVEAQDRLRFAETQNHELKTTLADLNSKYNELEANHLDLIGENGGTLKKIADLERELSKHPQQIRMLEVQLRSVRDELAAVGVERDSLQREVKTLKEEFNMLQELSSEQHNKNCSLKRTIEELQRNLESGKEENLKLDKEVANLNKIIEEKNDKKTKKSEEFKTLSNEKRNIEDLLEKRTEDFESLSKENGDLKAAVNNLKVFEEKYRNILDENHNLKEQVLKIAELEKQKLDVSNDNKRAKHEILDLKIAVETLKSIEGENLKLIEDIEAMRSQIAGLLNENQTVKDEIGRLRGVEIDYKEGAAELNNLKQGHDRVSLENSELLQRNRQLTLDYQQILHENEKHLLELGELRIEHEELLSKLDGFDGEKEKYHQKIDALNEQVAELKQELNKERPIASNETASLRHRIKQLEDETLDTPLKDLKATRAELADATRLHEQTCNDKKLLEGQLRELEKHYGEIAHEKQLLLDEVEELKTTPLNANDVDSEALRRKLDEYKSLDRVNRTSIEFYEHELQKLRTKNEKLGRRLDETLVTLPAIAASQEFADSAAILEYLRNVIFNYMTGKEGLVLAKVIAAVCKFDKDQTELVLQREQQKQSLLGHLFAS